MALSLTAEQRRRGGREGGKARAVRIREDVIERYEREGRLGYWLAYCAGRHASKVARQAAARKAVA
jgi:molybdenum-dependent DNA-binding transcriptional regulator ModE